eukprot:4492456-Amphidinium_carterae.2
MEKEEVGREKLEQATARVSRTLPLEEGRVEKEHREATELFQELAETDPTVKESDHVHRGDVGIWRSQKRESQAIEDERVKRVRFPQATATGSGSSDIPQSTASASGSNDCRTSHGQPRAEIVARKPRGAQKNRSESELPDRAPEEITRQELGELTMVTCDAAAVKPRLDVDALDWRNTPIKYEKYYDGVSGALFSDY